MSPGVFPSFFNLLNLFHPPPQQSASATALTTDQQVTSKRRLFLCFLCFGLALWCQSRVPVPARELAAHSGQPRLSVSRTIVGLLPTKSGSLGELGSKERFRDLGSLSFWRGVVGHGLCVATPPPPQIHRGERGVPGLVCLCLCLCPCLVCLEGNKAALPSLSLLFPEPLDLQNEKNVTVQSTKYFTR